MLSVPPIRWQALVKFPPSDPKVPPSHSLVPPTRWGELTSSSHPTLSFPHPLGGTYKFLPSGGVDGGNYVSSPHLMAWMGGTSIVSPSGWGELMSYPQWMGGTIWVTPIGWGELRFKWEELHANGGNLGLDGGNCVVPPNGCLEWLL